MGSFIRRQKVLSAIKRLSKQEGVSAYNVTKALFKDYTSSERAKVRSLLEVAVKKGILMKHGSRYELASKLNNTFSRSKRNRKRRRTKTSSSTTARRGRRSRRRSRGQTRRRHKKPMSYFQKLGRPDIHEKPYNKIKRRRRSHSRSSNESFKTCPSCRVHPSRHSSCSDSSYKTCCSSGNLDSSNSVD